MNTEAALESIVADLAREIDEEYAVDYAVQAAI